MTRAARTHTGAERPGCVIYTDGCAIPNPGPGGWAALIIFEDRRQIALFDSHPHTSNIRMELIAAIKALRALYTPHNVTFYTDLQLICEGMSGLLKEWRSKRKKYPNDDLWKQLEKISYHHSITWNWIKGHSGNENNQCVHRLAWLAAHREATRKPEKESI